MQLARVESSRGVPLGSVLVLREDLPEERAGLLAEDLVSTLSHELRSPLATIQGFLVSMLDEPNMDAELRREFVVRMRQDAQRLGSLLENLIELARLRTNVSRLTLQGIDLVSLTEEAVRTVSHEFRIGVQDFALDMPGQPLMVDGDRRRLKHVLVELLRNAVRHGWSRRGVRVSLRGESHRVVAEVRDWGEGLAASDTEKVFGGSSSRVPRTGRGGRGLGLTFCRAVVDRHSGRIQAVSPDGGGLAVTVTLPRQV